MGPFLRSQGIHLRREIALVRGVFFNRHFFVNVEVEVRRRIAINDAYVNKDPRRVFSNL